MSNGVNKAIIIGNCCADPETRHLPSGNAVTNVNVATNESWKDKQTGEKQERAEFHRVVFFNKLAEIAGQYLRKGSKVYLEGRIQTDKYQAQDGTDRYATKIIANQMQMLDSRGGESGGQQSGGQTQQPNSNPQSGGGGGAPDFDSDVPFSPLGKEWMA